MGSKPRVLKDEMVMSNKAIKYLNYEEKDGELLIIPRMMPCAHETSKIVRQHKNNKYDIARTIFIQNEHLWFHFRDVQMLRQGLYSVPMDQEYTRDGKDKFFAMLEVNRCLFLTSASYAERLASPGTYFQNTLLDLCMLEPESKLTDAQKTAKKHSLIEFENQMKRNKLFDSGLSLAEERRALLYALLQHVQ